MSKKRTHVDLETNLLWWNDPCSWADWWTAGQTPWNTLGAWKCHQQPPPHQGFARVTLRCHCCGRSEKYLKYQQAYRLTEQCRRMAEVCGSFVNISEIILGRLSVLWSTINLKLVGNIMDPDPDANTRRWNHSLKKKFGSKCLCKVIKSFKKTIHVLHTQNGEHIDITFLPFHYAVLEK